MIVSLSVPSGASPVLWTKLDGGLDARAPEVKDAHPVLKVQVPLDAEVQIVLDGIWLI